MIVRNFSRDDVTWISCGTNGLWIEQQKKESFHE
jgi:hypothetical protein